MIWTGGIVGYGACDHACASGRTGTWMVTGFAPRKARLSICIMPAYADFSAIPDRLGPHGRGKSCVCLNRLEAVDAQVLAELIRAGLADPGARWPLRALP